MKLSEKKAMLRFITENIEMELFSSEDSCVVISTQEEEEDDEHSFHQRNLEHPLVPDREEEPEPEPEVQNQTQPKQKTKTESEPPARNETEHHAAVLSFTEDIEIEIEEFPPLRVSESELVEMKSGDSSIMTPPSSDKIYRVKWKRLNPQKTGLVVKDVICLPRELYLDQLERHIIPQGKDYAALVAMGMTARITIDYGWSASQMKSRLSSLFKRQLMKRAGQRFSFTYLQCVPGSRVLFVPDPPADGWTGEQVLRISGHGPLYIFTQQDVTQTESESPVSETPPVNKKEFYLDASTESCLDEDAQQQTHSPPRVRRTTDGFSLDLDTILSLFRKEEMDQEAELYVHVRRRDLLHGALKAVRRPSFCFRATPIVSFSGEETDGHEGPLREFFRLTLLELQQRSVFEGRPGRLFLTYDLTALEDRKYYEAGVLIGWSLAQGGPGPRCLHPALYELMCGHNPPLDDFSWSDVADAEVQVRLQQLQSCTDVMLLSSRLCDWVSSCGIPGISSARSNEIRAIYSRVVKHYIYHRVASMISQFTEGINSCGGLWDMIQYHWEVFIPVMTRAKQEPLTLEEFKQLFTVCYSEQDCELRAAEEATFRNWETVLTMISNGQADFSFEDILTFITGADHLPPLGFPSLISLRFYSQDALPHASTCALELYLPRTVVEAVELKVLLSRAVHEELGFTRFQSQGEETGADSCTEVMTSLVTESLPEYLMTC